MSYIHNNLKLSCGIEAEAVSKIAGFKLYIKGMNPESVKAVIVAKEICEKYLPERSNLEIIDTIKEPDRAASDGVNEIPTIVKVSPLPIRTISDQIDDPKHVLDMLGIQR